MKACILSLTLLISSLAQADDLKFLKGSFDYQSSEITSTKHIRHFYTKSQKEKDLVQDYREFGYACTPKSSKFVECSKLVSTNPHQIEPKTKNAALLAPSFTNEQKIELINDGDFTVTYNVEQETKINDFTSAGYKAYFIKDSGLYVDLEKKSTSKTRFQVVDQKTLSHLSFEREKFGKREFFIHNVSHTYSK